MKTASSPRLSERQLAAFWRLFGRAWSTHLRLHPEDQTTADDWRHEIIRRATGQPSIKLVDPAAGFDAVMLELAIESQSRNLVEYWSVALERRYKHLLDSLCSRISEYVTLPPDYPARVLAKAKLSPSYEDAPADHLRRVYQMLDTYYRRVQRAYKEGLFDDIPDDVPPI